MKESFNKIGFVTIAFFAALFCAGTFHEYISCIVSVFLAGWLIINHFRNKKTFIYRNLTILWVSMTVLLYGLSAIWAVDTGMAFIGFLKYLPLLLFALVLMQSDESETILSLFPYAVCGMVILSAVLAQFSSIANYFLVGDRLSGFLQYPNTFAILLLVAELLILTKPKIKNYDVGAAAILVMGLVYSTSRTVLLIALVANAVAILLTRSKRFIFCTVLAILGGGFIATVFFIATDNFQIIERLFTVSLKESSFVNRFLYYSDAFPQLFKHPFGTGYMGYSYMQSSFQSGIYSVSFVHNDFLQLVLDIGWIPALTFAYIFIKKILSKKTPLSFKIILSCLAVHSMFDFNLQFLSVGFLLLILFGVKNGSPMEIKDNIWLIRGLSTVLACVSLYIGTALVLHKADYFEESYALYPYNTNTETALLTTSTSLDESHEIATKMQLRNEYAHVSYIVKARHAYVNGDYDTVIEQMNKGIKIAPFVYAQYEEYARMLISGMAEYKKANDSVNEQKCISELKAIPQKLEALSERISYLGEIKTAPPQTTLPEALIKIIHEIE